MTQQDRLPAVGAILSGPYWPERVRVVRIEPRGANRVFVEAATLRICLAYSAECDYDVLHFQ